jgi:hypothetical protein
MRVLRCVLLVTATAAILLLPATGASAAEHLGLHDMDCRGITAHGEDLARRSTFHLKLIDRPSGRTLLERDVKTSAEGMFKTRLAVRLDNVLSIRMFVTDASGSEIGYADHVMEKGSPMCDLPFTGPGSRFLVLLGIALAFLASGATALWVSGRSSPAPRPAPGSGR